MKLWRGRAFEGRPALLFCNYLFVLIVVQWSPIASTPVVRRLVRDGEPPARVPERELERKPRHLTDSEMQRWHTHFEERLAAEREATAQRLEEERKFVRDLLVQLFADMREDRGGDQDSGR